MIKLGVNSVLFKHYNFAKACDAISRCGYEGVEISAIQGMCEHLVPDNWKSQKREIKAILEATGLKITATELASLDLKRLKKTYEAAEYFNIPVVNVGPGGKSDIEEDFLETIKKLTAAAKLAEKYGVHLCCKAHVGSSIYNTATTLRAMDMIESPAFGVDMDPSHIYRSNENPEQALFHVLPRMKHIHIRDCKGRGPGPGAPFLQACGRGDINLFGYIEQMVISGYDGPVNLEIIGPEQDMVEASIIAAESFGYINACLKNLGAK